jgi:methylthioribose-1-phosphate isomerase
MKVNGKSMRTIWPVSDNPNDGVSIIDQRELPFGWSTPILKNVEDVAHAIKDMAVRGAGLIGATAGFGMAIATLEAREEFHETDLLRSANLLKSTRPTAVNLAWAVDRVLDAINGISNRDERISRAWQEAITIADEDAEFCKRLGQHGLELLKKLSEAKGGKPLGILTHCNAGWLAFVDHGSATAPIYAAHDAGIPLQVFVDETRPRNQGASLTAWELDMHGVPHHLLVDNAGGHLMQHGEIDVVIVGTDRVSRQGDVANKIGTYLKALAAKDNNIPFYVALPSSTFDLELVDGVRDIPIEERDQDEVRKVLGKDAQGRVQQVQICPDGTPARNPGFDVTPARLISGLITEKGIIEANEPSILRSIKS